MATGGTILQDDSLVSRLDRALLPIERFMALVSGVAAFSLMFLAVWSVGGRNFFGRPLLGYVDYIEAMMPLIAIFGISYVQREGIHIRMDILIARLKGRPLWALELLGVLLMLVLMVALTWGAWAHFERSFDCTRPLCSRDSTIDVGMPLWPSKLIVPIAFAVLCLRLALQAWAYGRALVLGLPNPPAVPLVMTAAEQAAAEAEHLRGAEE